MASTNAFVLSATAEGVRLLMTSVSATAPACSNARAESYSQFVPGNTGMITRGRAMVPLYVSGRRLSTVTCFTASPSWRYGYTLSMAPSHASCSAAMSSSSPAAMKR